MANLPNPVTRKEQYLSVMAENTAQYPEEPITREEMYLDYLCKNGIGGGGTGGTTNYNQLTNRPQINGTTLEGNLTAEDLGLQPENLVVTLTQNGESITADKSYADINQAYTDGKDIYAVIEGNIVPLYGKAGTTYIFQSVLGVQVTDFELNSEDTWSVETINIIANSTRPGGIIADEKTDNDTVEVHVDSKTGKAYVNASQDTTTTPPIINTASGNPITLTDSSDNLLQGFEMDGKTEQVTTTGAQLFDYESIQSGIVTSASGDQRNGQEITGLEPGQYTISSNKKNIGTLCYLYSIVKSASGEYGSAIYIVTITDISTRTITINTGDTLIIYDAQIKSLELSKDLFAEYGIMVNKGSAALPYELYTGRLPSPSPDYPQPIINGGTYDEEAEKWEYEITITNAQTDPDKNQTVTLTADRPLTKWDRLEKRDGQWGWSFGGKAVELDGMENRFYIWKTVTDPEWTGITYDTIDGKTERSLVFCNYFPSKNIYGSLNDLNVYMIDGEINFTIPSIIATDVESWKSWLSEKKTKGKPMYIVYQLKTPEWVDLSDEESAALDALVSYYPTTVISNQQGLNMTVDYIVDTKTYIDNKFAELQQSLANTNAQLLGGN